MIVARHGSNVLWQNMLSLRGEGAFWDSPPSATRFRYRAGACIGATKHVAEPAASIDEVGQ
jgi:hypothetical protein